MFRLVGREFRQENKVLNSSILSILLERALQNLDNGAKILKIGLPCVILWLFKGVNISRFVPYFKGKMNRLNWKLMALFAK